MPKAIEHTQGFLQARAAAENDREPDWPAVHTCRRCGGDIWRVVTQDGDDIELDSEVIEVEVGGKCDGDVLRARSSVFWPQARVVDGWRLEEPVEACVGWLWGATPAALARGLVEPLFSEHVYLCSHASEREIRSLVADGLKRSKQRHALGLVLHDGLAPAVARRPQPIATEQRKLSPRRSEQLALWSA